MIIEHLMDLGTDKLRSMYRLEVGRRPTRVGNLAMATSIAAAWKQQAARGHTPETLTNLKLFEIQRLFARLVGGPTCADRSFLLSQILEALQERRLDGEGANNTETDMTNDATTEVTDNEENGMAEANTDAGDARRVTARPTPRRAAREGLLGKMTIEELQTLYLTEIGRPSASTNRRYLQWKIGEARKGRVTIGPVERNRPTRSREDDKVIPLRLSKEATEALDTAWLDVAESRMDFIRYAISKELRAMGEHRAAGLIEAC